MTAQLLNDRAVMESLDTLTLHPRNPNRADVQELADSIRAIGWYGVLIVQVSTRHILKGNHSAQAAREAGLTQVPVFWVDVDDATAYKILLGDNEYAAHGVRDREAVLDILRELQDGGHGLEGTGFTDTSYRELLQELQGEVTRELLTDEDDTPSLQERTITRPGDLWQIGPHRVHCGDSTNPAHLARLLNGQAARLTVTDPPYNVAYEGKTKDRLKIANDAMSPEEFAVFIREAMQATGANMSPGACIYVFYAEVESVAFHQGLRAGGFKYSQTLVWVKNAANMSRQDYNWRHEPALYGWKEGAAHYYCQDFTQTTVIDDSVDLTKLSREQLLELLQQTRDHSTVLYENKPTRNDIHPTMKPVRLYERALLHSSQPGWPVLDPFGGSGTLLIAAHKHGRVAYLNELGPNYVDQIIRRAQAATGLTAVRHDGLTFNDLEKESAA